MIRFGVSPASAHNQRPVASVSVDDDGRGGIEVSGVGSHATEYELVQELVAGDAAAWRAFVAQYERLVLTRVAVTAREIHQSLNGADLEDLCAEVFCQLVAKNFAALRDFEGRCALSTWLCVITRRLCLRKLAAIRREPSRPGGDPASQVENLASRQDNPLAALIQGESQTRLDAALAELPERHRELVRLFYMEGFSYREISDRLGIPTNSIGPTLQRVQQKLREHMSS